MVNIDKGMIKELLDNYEDMIRELNTMSIYQIRIPKCIKNIDCYLNKSKEICRKCEDDFECYRMTSILLVTSFEHNNPITELVTKKLCPATIAMCLGAESRRELDSIAEFISVLDELIEKLEIAIVPIGSAKKTDVLDMLKKNIFENRKN